MSRLHAALEQKGYAFYKAQNGLSEQAICQQLGQVINMTDVRITPGKTQLVYSNEGLGFHNDSPFVDYMVWICIEPGSPVVPTLISDWSNARTMMTPSEIEYLESVKVQYADEGEIRSAPLLNGNKIFLWDHGLQTVDRHHKTVRKLRSILRSTQKQVSMAAGDILAIDNKRICHARPELNSNNSRHLRRYWIKK